MKGSFQGPHDAIEMGFWGCWSGGAEEAWGLRWEHMCSTPWPPREQLPHLSRTKVTMAGQQTLPESSCNDRNNSSYSLPNEKKLRMDRTGKHPVPLKPVQTRMKTNICWQYRMACCPAEHRRHHRWLLIWGSSAGPFVSWGCAHRKTWATSSCLGRNYATWWGSRTLCPGELCYSLLSLRQCLVKHGAGFRLDPPLGFMLQNQRMLCKWWRKCHIRGTCGRSGVQHTPVVSHWVLLPKQEAKSTLLFHKGEAKHLLLNPGILMPEES